MIEVEKYPHASLLRRFAAMLYDAFLIVAIWMTSTTAIVAMVTDGEEATGIWFQLFLYAELALFYIYFWHAKGQSLGMQVWKIQLVSDSGESLSYAKCLLRFIVATASVAAFGLGFFWMYFNPERRTWHDLVSGSHVLYLGHKPYQSEQL